MRSSFVLILVCLLVTTTGLFGAAPFLLNYQGRLTDNAGIPLDGIYQITFVVYNSETEGASLWTETHTTVNVHKGLFAVILGSVSPIAPGLFVEPTRFLAISVNGGPELTPRQQLVSAAYSFHSYDSDMLEGESAAHYHSWTNLTGVPAGFADGVDNQGSGDITDVNAGEGLEGGATSGSATLGIADAGVTSIHLLDGTILNADINASAAIATNKISGTAMNLSTAQIATASKTFDGGLRIGDTTFYANGNGIVIGTDVYVPSSTYLLQAARNYSTTGSRYGIYADLDNFSTGTVYGIRSRASGATAGAANAGTVYGFYGVGITDGESRYGAYFNGRGRTVGLTTGSSHGLYCDASYGAGAYGAELHASDATSGYGLYVEVNDNQIGTGVYTHVHDNTASSASNGSTNFVLDNGGNAYGISGTTGGNAGTGFAVYGHSYSNATNWSGYFTGDVYVGGNVYMPAKVTRLDHPADPENQYLQLAGIESPEYQITQSGNVTTDASGKARVSLAAYFALIAANFRYNLTVIGQFAQAIVAEEFAGDGFTIATDKPNVKVSWTLTGTRIDNFAKSHPLVNESAKPADQRGRYLHPEEFGVAPERGVSYQIQQELERQKPQGRTSPTEDELDQR